MAQFVVEDQPDRTIPANTLCSAVLMEIKEDTVKYTDRKTGEPATFEKLNWWFEIVDGEHAGRKVRGETDARVSNHPRNRVRAWAEVLLGRELPVGTAFDTDDLIGLPAQIRVDLRADRKDPDKMWEYVADLEPAGDDSLPF